MIGTAVVAVAALAAVYGVFGVSRNPGDPACRPALDVAHRLDPLVHGEVAAVRPAEEARLKPAPKKARKPATKKLAFCRSLERPTTAIVLAVLSR